MSFRKRRGEGLKGCVHFLVDFFYLFLWFNYEMTFILFFAFFENTKDICILLRV